MADNIIERKDLFGPSGTQITGDNYGDSTINFATLPGGPRGYSIQFVYDVNTPSAKTFDNGTSEVSTLTFQAKADTDPGDYIVVYDTLGNAWAVYADTTGSDPEPTGDVWAAIPAGQKTSADITLATDAASVAAIFEVSFDSLTDVPFATDDSAADGTMLITQTLHGLVDEPTPYNEDDSGAGSIAAATTTPGVATEVSVANDTVTIPNHGLTTGLKGQLSTTGTLPAGLSLATDYFIIVVNDDTVAFASSLANALLGTKVPITDEGSSAGVNTFTSTALAGGSIQIQKSNDGVTWFNEGSAISITVDGSTLTEIPAATYGPITYGWMRVKATLTAGRYLLNAIINLVGETNERQGEE